MKEEDATVVQQGSQDDTPSEGEQAEQSGEQPNAQHLMTSFLDAADGVSRLRRGQVVDGVIVQIRPSEILVDVGAKSEGVIWGREIERLGPEGLAALHEGDPVLVYVITLEDKNGNPVLSLSRAQSERDWREAERLLESGELCERTVVDYNRGGLLVNFGRVRGFVPRSHIVSLRGRRRSAEGEDPLAELVGNEMQLKVIEINRDRTRLILSERAAMREQRRQNKEKLLAELQEGDVRKGEVVNICDFGAFVDVGGVDGLIHLSELSWRHVSHPSDILKVDDEVEVYVLNVDRERKRIGLSLKQLAPDPWSLVAERYHVGQLVEGTITKLVEFGAFSRILDDDIEGLIHISELSEEQVSHPREVVQEGDVRTLRIIRIDLDQHRVGLSLKRVISSESVDVDRQEGYEQAKPGEAGVTDLNGDPGENL
jgi:small subunit ribosomal protein S1